MSLIKFVEPLQAQALKCGCYRHSDGRMCYAERCCEHRPQAA